MPQNSNLSYSARNKHDEFYTQFSMIENELQYYTEKFRGKTILCNCDDPYESNFFKYFAVNFTTLKLKKLIATSYVSAKSMPTQLYFKNEEASGDKESVNNKAYKIEITDVSGVACDDRCSLADVSNLITNSHNALTLLHGDGDFRSDECIELLKEADMVVTNPPFSLFREYINQLMTYQKKFLIVGNLNNVTYSDVWPLIVNNEVRLGYNSGHFWFRVPDSYEKKKTDFKTDEKGQKWRRMGNICWYTNLDVRKNHENIPLVCMYSPEKYESYLNCDAINVSNIKDIPCDYNGLMGVPVSFLSKYNPEQFDLLGIDRQFTSDGGRFKFIRNGKIMTLYVRLVIRRKNK